MVKVCIVCDQEFDTDSPEKRSAGGLITHCPDCSEETEIKYVGLQSADGKQAQATILKFENEEEKERYVRFWQNNSGLHKGKSCQLGNHLSTTPKVKFSMVSGFTPTNHKGKA
jgi:hypothetical protein